MTIKLNYITLLAGIVLSIVSCNKNNLNSPPADLLSSEGFYETPAQCEQAVIGIYSSLRNRSDDEYLYMSECRSDNAWVEPQTNGLREYSEIGTFRAGNDITTFNAVWNGWYRVIYNANVAIAKIPDCDFGTSTQFKDQLLGEAYFLRGWAYFELARLFGNIPLISEPMKLTDVNKVPQSSAKDVINNLVIPDLKAAKAKLPLATKMVNNVNASVTSVGRADQIAAQAMLGRVYMTMAGFPFNDATALAPAETELKGVITFSESNGNKYWAPDSTEWRKQFMPTAGYYNKYPIFSIQYRIGGTGNPALFDFSPALPPTYTARRIFGNSIWVEKSLMYEFDKTYVVSGKTQTDSRGYNYSILTGFAAEPNFPAYTQILDTLNLPNGSVVNVFTRSMFYKFLPSKRKITALAMNFDAEAGMKDDTDWGVNLPIIRYEDVLLMYAEILTTKDVAGAMTIVNRIRSRAGCSPETATTAASALAFVKRERRIEFAGEGVRWFDLIRWNEWQSAIVAKFNRNHNPAGTDVNNVKPGRYLFPIPLGQMQAKPGLYAQNAGY